MEYNNTKLSSLQKIALKRGLSSLYREIMSGDFSRMDNDDSRMFYYGKKQGDFLRIFRESRGLSLQDVSGMVSISMQTLNAIENGNIYDNDDEVLAYAYVIGATVEMERFLDIFETARQIGFS